MNTAVVGLGSNINSHQNIKKARALISKAHNIIAESKFVQTEPIGYKKQADFTNGAFLILTTLNKEGFQSFLKKVEAKIGRKPTPNRFGPRVIDLDLLVWNNEVVGQDFYNRDFMQRAVLELIPGLKF